LTFKQSGTAGGWKQTVPKKDIRCYMSLPYLTKTSRKYSGIWEWQGKKGRRKNKQTNKQTKTEAGTLTGYLELFFFQSKIFSEIWQWKFLGVEMCDKGLSLRMLLSDTAEEYSKHMSPLFKHFFFLTTATLKFMDNTLATRDYM